MGVGFNIILLEQTNCKMYMHYTIQLHCTLSHKARAQSARRQLEKGTSEKSEMGTYKDTTQVARYMWLSLILIKLWGSMWHNMLERLVIYILVKLALHIYECTFFFEFIKRNHKIAKPIILGKWTNYKLYIHYTIHCTQYSM